MFGQFCSELSEPNPQRGDVGLLRQRRSDVVKNPCYNHVLVAQASDDIPQLRTLRLEVGQHPVVLTVVMSTQRVAERHASGQHYRIKAWTISLVGELRLELLELTTQPAVHFDQLIAPRNDTGSLSGNWCRSAAAAEAHRADFPTLTSTLGFRSPGCRAKMEE